jgi:hypothetical protein
VAIVERELERAIKVEPAIEQRDQVAALQGRHSRKNKRG